MYYVGKRRNKVYIINDKDNESAVFDTFGEFIEMLDTRSARIQCVNLVTPIDVLSIVGDNNNTCSLYFNGKTTVMSEKYINIFSEIRDKILKFDGMIYRLENKEKGYIQVILLLQKDKTNLPLLSKLLNIKESDWN